LAICKTHSVRNPYIREDSLVCYTCGKPIKVGEVYHTSSRGSGRFRKFRHYDCAKRVKLV